MLVTELSSLDYGLAQEVARACQMRREGSYCREKQLTRSQWKHSEELLAERIACKLRHLSTYTYALFPAHTNSIVKPACLDSPA